MKLLVIVLCLVAERFLVHQMSFKRFQWFTSYAQTLSNRFISFSPGIVVLSIILPLCLLTGGVMYLFGHALFGMLSLCLQVVIFYYCLGPLNPFYPLVDEHGEADVGLYLAHVNEQLFAVIFWYLMAGVEGALIYRLLSLCVQQDIGSPFSSVFFELVNWLPTRVSALFYLFVGHFQQGFVIFTNMFLGPLKDNTLLLSQCGLASIERVDGESPTLAHAQTHVEHATLLWLFLLAMYAFVA